MFLSLQRLRLRSAQSVPGLSDQPFERGQAGVPEAKRTEHGRLHRRRTATAVGVCRRARAGVRTGAKPKAQGVRVQVHNGHLGRAAAQARSIGGEARLEEERQEAAVLG